MHKIPEMVTCFSIALRLAGVTTASGEPPPPDWLPDPANSRWIVFGGEDGIAQRNGIAVRPAGKEGKLTAAERAGKACAQSVMAGVKMGYFYLKTEQPWTDFRKWLGERNVPLLTIRYFDGAKGTMVIQYDSSDPRVKKPPYPAGAWKVPPAYPKGVALEGTKKWKTETMPLPQAFFSKRLHGGDIRIRGAAADFALAGVALTRVPAEADPELIARQSLRAARAEGAEPFGRGIRFAGVFAQKASEPLVMEAELATELSVDQGHSPGADATASGGGYIDYVDGASWTFTIKAPGRYTVWERASFPWGGFWNHTESMDDEPGVWVADNRGKPPEGWKWVRGGTYELTAGEHTFGLTYQAGARLDVLVLTRDQTDTPPDLDKLVPSYRGPTGAELWTTPVRPFDVNQWRAVQFETQNASEEVTCRLSTDGGKTWRAFDPDEALTDLETQGKGNDQIVFQLKLKGKEGRPPMFAGGTLTYLAGRENTRVVENAAVRLELDPYGVRRVFDKRRNTTIAEAPELHTALTTLLIKPPGFAPPRSVDLYNCVLEDFQLDAEDKHAPRFTITHTCDLANAGALRVITTGQLLPSGGITWRLGIENRTALEVSEIQFPVITGCRLGEDAADDWMFLAKCWGQVWQNPGGGGPPRTHWGPSMRWTMLWDERSGLYMGIEDPRFDDYGFTYGADSSGGITLAPTQRILVQPGKTWQSAVYRIALTGGDWHEGADIYRAYVAKALKPADTPPHIKWLVDAWIGQDSNRLPQQGWDVIANTWQKMEPAGILLMPANRQMLDGADSCYCGLFPYPSPVWGSTHELEQKLEVLKAQGGMYTPYHNFHLWSPGYGHYRRVGTFPKSRLPKDIPIPDDQWYRQAATYGYAGSYRRLETDHFAQVGMAMGSLQWRDWLAYWTRRYLGWGADGMYYDQFNMIYPNGRLYEDFPTYGCWLPATIEVITRIRKAARKENPYYTPSGEVCNDILGQYMDLHMTSGVFNRLEFYRYCNPDDIIIDGAWNGGFGKWLGGPDRKRFIWQVGARFENWGGPPGTYDGGVLALRRAVKSLIYDARFMDTVGLQVVDARGKTVKPVPCGRAARPNAPVEGVIGRWFLYKQGDQRGAVVNMINAPVKKRMRVKLNTKAFGPVKSATAWTLDGKCGPITGEQKGDIYTFAVPEAELSSVVLSNRLCPVVEWHMDNVAAPGVMRKLHLTLTNVNAIPVSGTATLRLPKGWEAGPPVQFGPVAPRGRLEFVVPVRVPDAAPVGRYDVWCDVETELGRFSTYNFIVVNKPVLADFRGDPGGYYLWFKNVTTRPFTGTIRCSAPKPLSVAGTGHVKVPPEAEVRVPVSVRGHDELTQIAEMAAAVEIGGEKRRLVRGVIPPVPNGGFESDSAGDMKPDWWMCRCVRDHWSYERMHLDTDARSGKYSLRLDPPQRDEEFICAYPVHSMLKPNTRYRVSIWMKCKSPTGVYLNLAGRLGKGKTADEWRRFTSEFTTGPRGGSLYRALYNSSSEPAYFDDLILEEIDR